MVSILLIFSLLTQNAGTSGFEFLRTTPGAREAAMGSSTIGFGDALFSYWFNPSLLTLVQGPRVGLTYLKYLAGINSGSFSYINSGGDWYLEPSFGAGLSYLNTGSMKRTDKQNRELGTYSASFANLYFAHALKFGEVVNLGIGLKCVYGAIDTFFGIGIGVDFGGTINLPIAGTRLGLAVKNLGFQVKPFRQERDKLPLDFGIGIGYTGVKDLVINFALHKPVDNRVNFRLGFEGFVTPHLALRAGYNSQGTDLKTGSGGDILAGSSFGLGIKIARYIFDYSFVPMLDLGNTHRFTIGLNL